MEGFLGLALLVLLLLAAGRSGGKKKREHKERHCKKCHQTIKEGRR